MVKHLKTRAEFEQYLNAIENDEIIGTFNGMEFRSVFQPIYRADQTVLGFEALVRVGLSNGESVCPSFLFRQLEPDHPDYGNQVSIDKLARVIHLRNFARYSGKHAIFLNILPSSAVLSATRESNYLLLQRLRELGIPRHHVVLEVVEHCHNDSDILTLSTSNAISNGFNVAIDDYGVEGSPEERARKVKPNVLKIDRSLLQQYMAGNKDLILNAISLAKDIQADVLVEGIESQQEYEAMKTLPVDYFQGFHLGVPQPLHTFYEMNPHELIGMA